MQNMLEVSRILQQYNFHFSSVFALPARAREPGKSIALSPKRSALTCSNISGSRQHIRVPPYLAYVFMYYERYAKTFACLCTYVARSARDPRAFHNIRCNIALIIHFDALGS